MNSLIQVPDDNAVGHLHGIVQSSDGSIWVQNAHQDPNNSCLWRCEANGTIVETLTSPLLAFPHGLEIYRHPRHGECLLITDNHTGLFLMNLNGDVIWHVDKPDFYKLHWQLAYCPSNTAIASDGRIFMADGYGSYFISTFSSDGDQLHTFAGPQLGEQGLVHPHGCGIIQWNKQEVFAATECMLSSQDPRLLSQYDSCSCIKLFDLNGNYLERIQLDTISPRHIRPLSHGGFAIPDFQGRVLLTDQQFSVQKSLGATDERFQEAACDDTIPLSRPHDIYELSPGHLLMTDFTGHVVALTFGDG